MVGRKGPNLFYENVENRLLCCNVRKVQPLTQAPRHARRLDHRAAPRPVGDPHEHPQDRDRPRPRRDRQAEPARRVDGGRGLGLRPRATSVPYHSLYDQGYTSIGCAPCTRAIKPGEADARRPLVVGVERAEGVRHPLRDRDRRLRARAARHPRRQGRCLAPRRADQAQRGGGRRPPGEAQAVLAAVQDEERRGRLADLIAAIGDGELGEDDAQAARGAPRARAPDRPRPGALRPGRRDRPRSSCTAGSPAAASCRRARKRSPRRSPP